MFLRKIFKEMKKKKQNNKNNGQVKDAQENNTHTRH